MKHNKIQGNDLDVLVSCHLTSHLTEYTLCYGWFIRLNLIHFIVVIPLLDFDPQR